MRTGVEELDSELRRTRQWIAAVHARLKEHDLRLAMTALQDTLHALRDQLDPELAARFAEHLPLPLKGAYYEGWRPSAARPAASADGFLARVDSSTFQRLGITVERAVKTSIEIICGFIPATELSELAAALPDDLRRLWPDEPAPYPEHRTGPTRLH
ncbi:MAG: DUF2267 domain-containing protein [Pseudomonadota bacterium]